MPSNNLNYTKACVIVHGKTELLFTRYICTNLHLKIKPIAKDKGKTSIQINGLLKFMNGQNFKSLKAFAEFYSIEYDPNNKSLKDFKFFIIMDTDDCDEKTKEDYITGRLFKNHILSDYIVPIYNIENFEDVMIKANISTKKIPSGDKGKYYSKIFPINTSPLSMDTIKEVKTFMNKIKDVTETNMNEFIDYCLSLL